MEVFGATSTTEEVLSGVNLHGKRILVTGVSAGFGVETAPSLGAHAAQVVDAARNLTKVKAAPAQVLKEAAPHVGSFELVALDLAELMSVRHCTDALLAKGEPFDVVIANAGVIGHAVLPLWRTALKCRLAPIIWGTSWLSTVLREILVDARLDASL